MAKLTSKNQLTLPKAVMQALGYPSHFKVQVHEGVLLLWPARVVSVAEARENPGGGDGRSPAAFL
jgi:hypothetical protein